MLKIDASAPERIEAFFQALNFRPSRRLGQNFLNDDTLLSAIANAGVDGESPFVFEIGPGPGTLTRHLLRQGKPLVAIEKDSRVIPWLTRSFASVTDFSLIHGDILAFDFGPWIERLGQKPPVVGNIPYSITSPILFHLLAARDVLGRATLLVQKEVAERLCAEPGSKAYGSLTLLFRLYADVDTLLEVPRQSFVPAPRVDSALLSIRWLERPRIQDVAPKALESLVRRSFAHRRKTLRNNLKGGWPEESVEGLSQTLGLDLQRRAETFSLEEFAEMARALGPEAPQRAR
jgi:16S rRNA (adenine1518-N6/adenine1519-N6)-dimethyltransferase